MIALDQMPGGQLDPQKVVAELGAADSRIQDAAWWIVSRHPQEWGGLLADQLRKNLADKQSTPDEHSATQDAAGSAARAPGLSTWIIDELTAAGVSPETRMLLLDAMGDAGGQFADPRWVESLLRILQENKDAELAGRLIATLGKMPPRNPRQAGADFTGPAPKLAELGARRRAARQRAGFTR